MKHWVDELASRQGIELPAGRPEKVAPGIDALLATAAKDPLRDKVAFEVDPTTYQAVLERK